MFDKVLILTGKYCHSFAFIFTSYFECTQLDSSQRYCQSSSPVSNHPIRALCVQHRFPLFCATLSCYALRSILPTCFVTRFSFLWFLFVCLFVSFLIRTVKIRVLKTERGREQSAQTCDDKDNKHRLNHKQESEITFD